MASAETTTNVGPSGKALPGAVHKAPGRSASQPQGKAPPPSAERSLSPWRSSFQAWPLSIFTSARRVRARNPRSRDPRERALPRPDPLALSPARISGYVTCSRVCKQNGKAREQCYLSHAPLECSRASLQGPLALLQEPAPSVTPSGLSDRQPCVMEPGLAQGKQQAR